MKLQLKTLKYCGNVFKNICFLWEKSKLCPRIRDISLTTMVEMDEKKLRILEDTGKLILKYGVKSMTMDDIARELGMSKKTLYLYCADKNDLIKQVIQLDMKVDHQRICSIIDKNLNAIDESFEIFKTIVQNVGDVPPNILYDLKKYHPEAYTMHREFMWKFSRKCIEENLIKGINEGYYRQDMNPELISTNYILMVMNIFENSDAFGKDVHPIEIYKEIFKYHVNAIASNKGRKYLSEKYSSMNFNQ
jgi:TetR/AcrR family transcriptional regulator, cholesterol catabolism regulator